MIRSSPALGQSQTHHNKPAVTLLWWHQQQQLGQCSSSAAAGLWQQGFGSAILQHMQMQQQQLLPFAIGLLWIGGRRDVAVELGGVRDVYPKGGWYGRVTG
jgi:hypothetical protein